MSAPGESLHSRLYACVVDHARFRPRLHAFRYRLFYLALDLDELPVLTRRLRVLAINRRGLAVFREDDYFPVHEPAFPPGGAVRSPSSEGLKQRVIAWCADRGFDPGPGARVVLVTLPRVFGHHFNPVSFYFCFARTGEPCVAVAEVTNTFREVKPYLIPPGRGSDGRFGFALRTPKEFYVSPFSSLDLEFDFQLSPPAKRLEMRIDVHDQGRRVLHSALVGDAQPLTDRALAGMMLRFPAVTLRVLTLIHWQAFRLWLKRVPYFRKADRPDRQRQLHRPHASLQPSR